MKRIMQWINVLPVWQSRWRVMGNDFYAPTLDRALYLALHKWGVFGRDEKNCLSISWPRACMCWTLARI